MRDRQEKVAPLVREFQRAAAGLGKHSTVLTEKRQFVTALLAQIESTLGRSFSPALVAQYQTQLPDKKLLQAKLHEFYLANLGEGEVE
jgi:hypothetical protein